MLEVRATSEDPQPASADYLVHEHELKSDLESSTAGRPLEVVCDREPTMPQLDDPGGEPLDRLLGAPIETGSFLHLATSIAAALGRLHQSGLVHRDIKPPNILVNKTTGEVRITGFGIASRLVRERQAPHPPETIAGTLAYMAPEQTGRLNRSIDSRSDLYALGVTFYQMLTGALPFTAADPMEWVHCHLARRPVAPAEWLNEIPVAISAIVMKLLAKTAEDRYQTAAGLESDLRSCQTEWQAHGRIDDFPLGERDAFDRLRIPEKLYGRQREAETLLAAFDRVVKGGATELVLVSGYSGIGKSSVVNELQPVLVPPRGLFATGKFDQYKRDIPYSMLAQAFRNLIRPLLGLSEAEFASWRDALLQALGPNAGLIVDLVPEVKFIIGEPPPVPELSPHDAQRRFQLVFRRFLAVFARPEHPLALFLDDLQWLDMATLDLLEDLLIQPDVRHVLLIGAYRDNEVTSAHPMMRTFDRIRRAGVPVQDIVLAPLAHEHTCQLIADSLSCDQERVVELAELVHEKTAGNPFFVIQFLSALVDEKLITFDHAELRWGWDLTRIRAKGYTENVADLMVQKLRRLPGETQRALQEFACLGNAASVTMLSLVYGAEESQIHSDLFEAVCTELVQRQETSYKFIHDRVQEAAYLLIPERSRPERHLRIGRLLLAHTPPELREEAIFEIVNQLNRGAALISLREEREQLAELNLIAAQRAKASAAYASALNYFIAGAEFLADDRWERTYDLAFTLELNRAECEFLTGNFEIANEIIEELLQHGATRVDKAAAYRIKIDLHVVKSEHPQAVASALDCLKLFDIDLPAHPTDEQLQFEYESVFRMLGDRSIESLIDLPRASDKEVQAAMGVLSVLLAPSINTDFNLTLLHLCKMINLTLLHGSTDAAASGYAWFGAFLGPVFRRYAEGYEFGRLACEIVEKYNLLAYRAKTYFPMEICALWTQPIEACLRCLQLAFHAGVETGDLTVACYSCNHTITDLILKGDPLQDVWNESVPRLEFVRNARFRDVIDVIIPQQRFILSMQGKTLSFSTFSDEEFDERAFESQLGPDRMQCIICWYWILKLQAHCILGDNRAALDAASNAKALLWSSVGHIQLLDYYYYGALAVAAVWDDNALPALSEERREVLKIHLDQLREWAENGSPTFRDKFELVAAEVARIENRDPDAMRLYEKAIHSARTSGFIHNEALANEITARFYAARGFGTIAKAYLREARACYLRWGAEGKVRQLETLYPYLREPGSALAAVATTAARLEQLDFATVVKVSQAVSSEIVLEKLIDTLMRTAIEQAGAERGLLIIPRGAEPRIAAEAVTSGGTIIVHLRDEAVVEGLLPESVLQYVLRSHESVIIDDAATQATFAADPYVRQHKARSILCLPLLNQAKLIGALFLENDLAPGVFAPTQIAVLKLASSLAAIALENSRLYGDLREREAKIRRLVDANIIGIYIIDLGGQIIEANDAFLRMLGYEREDLVSGRLRWTDLTPPEWRAPDALRLEMVKRTGRLEPFEKEYFCKDGSRVPVLVGVARFEETGNQAVAFVLDLTKRKQAESEAHESARRFREAQVELEHASRVVTMGQLTASIAHEVNQPITATIGNAEAALRWLARQPPDLEETRQLLGRIVKDGRRVSNVVGRIRDLTRKAPPRMECMEINGAIGEVVELTRGEAMKNGVSLQTQLAEGLPLVEADRIQLQQVVLNLMINAIQAMGESAKDPRELSIRTSMNGSHAVTVSVQDSGPGVSPESLGRLFDPFYTTKPDGMGIGLSICHSIIESHKGRIWATADLPRGAAFHFTIPVARQ